MDLIFKDITYTGEVLNEVKVNITNQTMSVKELIEARVTVEVENYNNSSKEYFKGLVKPSAAEETLNGFKIKKKTVIDTEKQVLVALSAFQKNGYFILINDLQVTDLDEVITINEQTGVDFIKLTQLVGG